jgi:hypothetical protein
MELFSLSRCLNLMKGGEKMKKKLAFLAAIFFVGNLLFFPFTAYASTTAAVKWVAQTNQTTPTQKPMHRIRERHPEIRRAIRLLNRAYFLLNRKAAHDFGGHRVKAMQEIQEALQELRAALQYDKH